MIVDLITPFKATANKNPEYNVQIKSAYEIEKYNYKEQYGGGESFEVFHRNMSVIVNLINGDSRRITCDRMIEEFDKLLLIQNFEQVEFDLSEVESIVVE